MVQARPAIDYDDNGMEQPPAEKDWGKSIRDSMQEFVASIGESSKQLAEAAQRLAGDSLNLLDDAARKAQESMNASSTVADTAAKAAEEARHAAQAVQEEARRTADQVKTEVEGRIAEVLQRVEGSMAAGRDAAAAAQAAVDQAKDLEGRLRATAQQTTEDMVARTEEARSSAARMKYELEARLADVAGRLDAAASGPDLEAIDAKLLAIEETVGRAEAARAATEGLKSEIEARVGEVLQRIENGMQATQEAAGAARRAAEQALAIEGRLTAAHDSATRAEDAAAWAEQMKIQIQQRVDDAGNRFDEALASGRQMLQGMARQAEDLRLQSTVVPQEPTLGSEAQKVLERLEADYQLLTRLVQELHSRIAALATSPSSPATAEAPSMQEPPATVVEPERVAHAEPAVSPFEATITPAPAAAQTEREPATASQESWREPAPVAEPAITAPPAEERRPEPIAAGEALSGRIMVKVAPVPDFDRLLSLDGAFGRMPGVRNVTLADYAQEEVTFRLELEAEISVGQLAQRLSEGAGRAVEVVSSSADNVNLRLVA